MERHYIEEKLKQLVEELSIISKKSGLILECDPSGGINVLTMDRYDVGYLFYDSDAGKYQYIFEPNLPKTI
ncbi:hypothetical protein AF332_11840 [Sporosarcina globispora]|uniref:Uncharacterized protein n=1 Tax=Sporosarcina globispora TaxID=1459 RepID=A0A0M0GC36_SPOGL|nr:hypothetical protein [Sporosarcina globispora]KON87450.1 hypothetical protein AF332_11840 [Sporosarcina globispora]